MAEPTRVVEADLPKRRLQSGHTTNIYVSIVNGCASKLHGNGFAYRRRWLQRNARLAHKLGRVQVAADARVPERAPPTLRVSTQVQQVTRNAASGKCAWHTNIARTSVIGVRDHGVRGTLGAGARVATTPLPVCLVHTLPSVECSAPAKSIETM